MTAMDIEIDYKDLRMRGFNRLDDFYDEMSIIEWIEDKINIRPFGVMGLAKPNLLLVFETELDGNEFWRLWEDPLIWKLTND